MPRSVTVPENGRKSRTDVRFKKKLKGDTMDNAGLLSILEGFVNGTVPQNTDGIDWDRLIITAYMQNILPVIAYMNKLWKLCPDEKLGKKLNEILGQTVYTGANRHRRFEELSALFSENGIEHMPVKGWYLKELYPLPELRTFGDVDVLIHPADREKTDRLMLSEGFSKKEDWEPTYSYIRKNERYELHTNLMDGNLDGRADMPEYFERAWSFGEKRTGLKRPLTHHRHRGVGRGDDGFVVDIARAQGGIAL